VRRQSGPPARSAPFTTMEPTSSAMSSSARMSCGALEGREGKGAGGLRGDGHAGARACLLGTAAGVIRVPCRLPASCQTHLGACWNDDLAIGDALLQHARSKQHLGVGWEGDGAGGLGSMRRETGKTWGAVSRATATSMIHRMCKLHLAGACAGFGFLPMAPGRPRWQGRSISSGPAARKGSRCAFPAGCRDESETNAGQNQHRSSQTSGP
jgi:hypothetical protein